MQPAISQDQTLIGLTQVAAQLFGVPVSLCSIVGESTLDFAASTGWNGPSSIPRSGTYCEQVFLSREPVVVNDQSGSVAGLCFYAGHPIRTSDGAVIGSLCVADFEARYPSETQLALLPALASLAAVTWESRGVPHSLSMLAHEIRNPLNGVLGAAELLAKNLDNSGQRELLDALRGSAELLLQIVNRSLEQSGPKLTGTKPFPLRQLLKTLVRNLKPLSAQNDVAMTLHLDPALPESVIGNPIELSQVIQNLLGNALKFTPPGGEISIHAGPSSTAGRVSIAIEDNGPGLSSEVKQKLFQPYTQGPSSQFRNAEGTGLGLSISRELIARLGGELSILSEPSEGVTAIIDVPLETLPELPRGLQVLVVEDNAVNQFLARRLLQLLGCEAECVSEGSAALEILTSRHFDAILMDCLTPGMDGYATARRIRSSRDPVLAATPIIAVTGQDIEQCRHACLNSGMDSVIGKPFDLTTLRHELVVALKSGTSTGAEVFARSVGSLSPADEGH